MSTFDHDVDFVVIGSGFGGSVAALRLAEKGYSVLVLEKGKRYRPEDFPTTNWNLRKWLWMPPLGFFGFFNISIFRHVTVLSGAGVGGGSLVYANCLQIPSAEFFTAPSWAHLADWQRELEEFYPLVRKMLGATPNPRFDAGDLALQQLARDIGRERDFAPTTVSVYFGEPGVRAPDPYFGGRGPERSGCTFCGGCMVGCRHDAKNSLDKNYLYFARQLGARIQAESLVDDVTPIGRQDGSDGYRVHWRKSTSLLPKNGKRSGEVTCRGIVFAGGVLGTVDLLLRLRTTSLPRLSSRIGADVHTNSESLNGVTTFKRDTDFSQGLAIGSILRTDSHSHLEPVSYPSGSGFWRLFVMPLVHRRNTVTRLLSVLADLVRHPVRNARVLLVRDWAKRTQILLYMRTIDGTLRLRRGLLGLRSLLDGGTPPTPFMPEARELAERFAGIVDGKPMAMATEVFLGSPTTAHVLGGCVMGRDETEGVVDKDNRVFGYENMYACDGSTISANPGVNPSLTIAALAERAMSKVPPRQNAQWDTP